MGIVRVVGDDQEYRLGFESVVGWNGSGDDGTGYAESWVRIVLSFGFSKILRFPSYLFSL